MKVITRKPIRGLKRELCEARTKAETLERLGLKSYRVRIQPEPMNLPASESVQIFGD